LHLFLLIVGTGGLGMPTQVDAQLPPEAPPKISDAFKMAEDKRLVEHVLEQIATGKSTGTESDAQRQILMSLLAKMEQRRSNNGRCDMSPQSEYYGYIWYSWNRLAEHAVNIYAWQSKLVVEERVLNFLRKYTCGQPDYEAVIENAVIAAMGDSEWHLIGKKEKPIPFELYKESVFDMQQGFIDCYCRFGWDPACAKLMGFIAGLREQGCFFGHQVEAAPRPPKLVQCTYALPHHKNKEYSGRRFTYWYQRVPNELDSLRVYGVDQLTSIAKVAVEACPRNIKDAAALSGDRRGSPAMEFSLPEFTSVSIAQNRRADWRDVFFPNDYLPGHIDRSGRTLRAYSSEAQLMPVRQAQHREKRLCETTAPPPPDLTEGDYALLKRVPPVYPARVLSRGIEGWVTVSYTITESGNVADIVVVESSSQLFERSAIKAVSKYRFKPRVVDGTPIEVTGVTETIEYKLDE
jgi:TonB family protein